jgi:hypothetical protein
VGTPSDILHQQVAQKKQYSATSVKHFRFKEAALLAQQMAEAEEKGQTQALLFTMLQEQHAKQITAMAEANKDNMEAMMTRMNALVAAAGGVTPPIITSTPATGKILPKTKEGEVTEKGKSNSALPPVQMDGPPQAE